MYFHNEIDISLNGDNIDINYDGELDDLIVAEIVTNKPKIVSFLKEKLEFIEGAVGCLTVQVFLNEETGRIVAIEINPRFGGGYPLSYRAGANYPLWLIKEYYNNETIDYSDDWEENLLMLRYDDEVIVHANKN